MTLQVGTKKSPLTLCLLNYEYPPVGAGAASATQEIANSLTRQGHSVIVVTAGFGDLRGERLEDGIRTIRLSCRRSSADRASLGEMLSFTRAAWKRLSSIVSELEVDAVICFFALPCGLAAWNANRKTGVAYVISLRGGDVPGLVPSITWIHRLLGPFRRAILRNALSVVANSDGLRQLSLATDPIPVRVIPNGVNARKFHPSFELRNDNVFRVLAVGRLQTQKNHVFALRTLACIQLRDVELEYHIVGDGPLKADLEALVDELGMREKIIWHGWTPRDRLAQIYASSDCLFHPTLYEGMPNVVLEAMASGLSVIASDVPGNNDLVRDGKTGLLCRLGDATAFIEAVSRLADDEPLRQRLGRAAREMIEEEYSWDSVAGRYVELLHCEN